jgi:PAS domain S-box-containing protein
MKLALLDLVAPIADFVTRWAEAHGHEVRRASLAEDAHDADVVVMRVSQGSEDRVAAVRRAAVHAHVLAFAPRGQLERVFESGASDVCDLESDAREVALRLGVAERARLSIAVAERATQIAEERFLSAVRMSPDGLSLLEAVREGGRVVDFIVREVSDVALRSHDVAREDVVGRRLRSLPSNVACVMKHIDILIRAAEERTRYEGVIERDDPESGPSSFLMTVTPIGDGVALRMRDITTATRAEQALRESEEKFRALSEASAEGIVMHQRGTIVLSNATAERMYRTPPGGLIGKQLLDYVAPASRELVRRMSAAGHTGPYEGIAMRADGTTFPAEVHARMTTYRGEPTRLVTVHDISEKKGLEASLVLADRMASMGRIAAGVAHELNNPLAYVLMNLELAIGAHKSDAHGPSEVLHALSEARRGADRVKRIVRDLTAVVRTSEDPTGSADLRRVIEYARTVAQHEIKHRAELVVDIEDAPHVVGDEMRLGQVLLNLLVNAAHAIPEGASDRNRITVTVQKAPAGNVAIEVSDTGVGIPSEHLARIFDPFFTTKPVGSGTGLGLSICHGIVSSFGGAIEVESEVGRGTTFRVVLPRANEPSIAPNVGLALGREAARSAALEAEDFGRRRILVIDDEDSIRSVMKRTLSEHDLTTTRSAREALALIERGERFDVIFCDVMMPEMTGMDFHEAVSQRFPDELRKIVFLTGGAFTDRATRFLSDEKIPRLEKPFDMAALREALGRVLRNA